MHWIHRAEGRWRINTKAIKIAQALYKILLAFLSACEATRPSNIFFFSLLMHFHSFSLEAPFPYSICIAMVQGAGSKVCAGSMARCATFSLLFLFEVPTTCMTHNGTSVTAFLFFILGAGTKTTLDTFRI